MQMHLYALLLFYMPLQVNATLYEALKQPQIQSDTFRQLPSEPVDNLMQSIPLLPQNQDYVPLNINVNNLIAPRYSPIVDDTIYLQGVMLSTIGALSLMPESITNWSGAKLKEKSLLTRWSEHVSSGPVWDDDAWAINYIGHPVSGAYYYTMARNDGMSAYESAAFSTLMSTFFWEYGYEAFSETPSIQDIILTPLIGSLLGEQLFVLQHKLDENSGNVWGSKRAGDIAYFLIDPLGHIADGLEFILISCGFDAKVTMTIRTYPHAYDLREIPLPIMQDNILNSEREYGFVITIE
jgi:hypothetical protein